MNPEIDILIYSYKNKNLKIVIDSILKHTKSDFMITVFDQNPIDRSALFMDERISYTHIIWDIIHSPCEYKAHAIYNDLTAKYVLIMSDDIVLSDGWDTKVIDLIESGHAVLSGNGKLALSFKNKNFIDAAYADSDEVTMSNYIDRNFIFSKLETWANVSYPHFLKYNGEQEALSVNFTRAGVDIYSLPSQTYSNLGHRTIETLYVPFSINHNYNDAVEMLRSPDGERLLSKFGLDAKEISPLQYPKNDVLYNPYELKFQNLDARKFISSVKAIY